MAFSADAESNTVAASTMIHCLRFRTRKGEQKELWER
jgi:hypothetical protein